MDYDPFLLILENLKCLRELDLIIFDSEKNVYDWQTQIYPVYLIDSIKNLQSLRFGARNCHASFMQDVGLNCKKLKKLTFMCKNIDDGMIEALCKFMFVEFLEFENYIGGSIYLIIKFLSNLRFFKDSNECTINRRCF